MSQEARSEALIEVLEERTTADIEFVLVGEYIIIPKFLIYSLSNPSQFKFSHNIFISGQG
jgi:hypothetical protein